MAGLAQGLQPIVRYMLVSIIVDMVYLIAKLPTCAAYEHIAP